MKIPSTSQNRDSILQNYSRQLWGSCTNQQTQFIHFGHWWKQWDVFEILDRPKENKLYDYKDRVKQESGAVIAKLGMDVLKSFV